MTDTCPHCSAAMSLIGPGHANARRDAHHSPRAAMEPHATADYDVVWEPAEPGAPTTEAGRAYATFIHDIQVGLQGREADDDPAIAIRAIEVEAAADAIRQRDTLRDALFNLHHTLGGTALANRGGERAKATMQAWHEAAAALAATTSGGESPSSLGPGRAVGLARPGVGTDSPPSDVIRERDAALAADDEAGR